MKWVKLPSTNKDTRKIGKNTLWLIYEKAFRMILSLFVGLWVARYLGPTNYGQLNYAISLIGMLIPFVSLGLDGVVVKELAKGDKDIYKILGTTLVSRFISGFLLVFCLILIILLFDFSTNKEVEILILIISFSLVFKSFETIDLWFQANVESKYTVFSKNISYLLSAILKIILILLGASVFFFAVVNVIEFMLLGLFLLLMYKKRENDIKKWSFDKTYFNDLIKESWPLILSGLTISIYMKADTIMIGTMLNSTEVGLYSSAVKLAELWYVIPTALVTSMAPSIAKVKKMNLNYNTKIKKLFDVMVLSSLIVAIPVTLFSNKIVGLMYGKEYLGASVTLSIYIWASIFVFLGVAKTPWIINEGLIKFNFYATLIGAVLNIVGNYFLIPIMGINGAAISTIVTQAFASVLVFSFFKKTRPVFNLMIKSIVWPFSIFKRNE
nr:flippase [Fredinandcohnia onubensis]